MKLTIEQFSDGKYYIDFEEKFVSDREIAQFLNIAEKEYFEILESCGAYREDELFDYQFDKKRDAKRAIEKLQPYLMMKLIVGE